jgi:DNA polymerase III gamma/tau subunit
MRNAVVALEKTLSFTSNIKVEDVERVLGVTSYDILFNMLDCLLNKDQTGLIANLDALVKSGMDLKLFVKNFLSFVLEINKYLILKTEHTSNPMGLIDLPSSLEHRLYSYSTTYKDFLKVLLKTLIDLNSSLRWETDVRPVLETNLLLLVLA